MEKASLAFREGRALDRPPAPQRDPVRKEVRSREKFFREAALKDQSQAREGQRSDGLNELLACQPGRDLGLVGVKLKPAPGSDDTGGGSLLFHHQV